MKKLNYQTGKLGESIAKDYLLKKNYQLICSNFRTRFGEVDLIVAKDKKLIFVETKLRIGNSLGTPEEMINQRKLSQVRKMAESFLQANPQIASKYPLCQIDAICIVLNHDGSINKINHWEDIGNEMV